MSRYKKGPLSYDNISAYLSATEICRGEIIDECITNNCWDGHPKDQCKLSQISAHIIAPSKYFTVTFNANGGTSNAIAYYVEDGNAIGELPDSVKEDEVLLGWFYDSAGTRQCQPSDKVTSDLTVYASYMSEVLKLTKVGSVVVDADMMASGFSSTSYLMSTSDSKLNFTDGLELVFRAKTTNSSPNQEIFGMTDADAFEFGANAGKFMWEIATGTVSTGTASCTNNKWYYWKITKDAGTYNYHCYYADGTNVTDAPTYIEDKSATRNANVNGTFAIGIDYWCGSATIHGEPWLGTIDLKNSYIMVNGKKVKFKVVDSTVSSSLVDVRSKLESLKTKLQ